MEPEPEPEPRTPEAEAQVAEAMRSAAERPADCRCNVVAVLLAEAGFFRDLAADEQLEACRAFFELQAEYLERLAGRFRDSLGFAQRMRAALERQ